jgi:hypothetical protein
MSPSFTFSSGTVSSVTGTCTASPNGYELRENNKTNTDVDVALTIEARIKSHDRGNIRYRPATSGQKSDNPMPMSGLY